MHLRRQFMACCAGIARLGIELDPEAAYTPHDPASHWHVLEHLLPQLAAQWRGAGCMPLDLRFTDGASPWDGETFNSAARLTSLGAVKDLYVVSAENISRQQFEVGCCATHFKLSTLNGPDHPRSSVCTLTSLEIFDFHADNEHASGRLQGQAAL